MVNFSSMRSSSQAELEKLNSKMASLNQPFKKDDERFWQPSVDAAGNGYAVVRFLPHHPEEELPFVRYWDHGFKGPGGWYIENSLTSIGESDPASEYNSELWNRGDKAGKDRVSGTPGNPGTKRRLHYISNIYVVDDPVNPKNNGKVFLFKYGKKIFDKLNEAMNPKTPYDPKFNPFDLWTGANFIIKISKEDDYRSYGGSQFDKQSPLLESDEDLKTVWESEYTLQDFLDPKNFKSYEELEKKLNRVLKTSSSGAATVDQEAKLVGNGNATVMKTRESKPLASETPPWETSDDDEELAAFKNLINK